MFSSFRIWSPIIIVIIFAHFSMAQNSPSDTTKTDSDTTKTGFIEDLKNIKVTQRIVKSITKKQSTNPTAAIKSEDFFMPYEGRIIRNIFVVRVGFERSVLDTARTIKNTMTRIGNRLHTDTREQVVRNHLFIREGGAVNPYKFADNERYLRDLDFIQDAKFFIHEPDDTDSIDVIVMTRDVFSIGGSFTPLSPTKTRFSVYDANLFGMGQRVQFSGLVEGERTPVFGYDLLYRQSSVGGSFINAAVGYTQLNSGSNYGTENEKAYFLRLDRPLVSPYTRMAGGIEISRNWSANFYEAPDTIFKDYRYQVNDFWLGYNFTAKSDIRDRSRHFFAIRAFNQEFSRTPLQNQERLDPIYSNRTYVLGGFSFFKQNFYTARYIYGFGRTEDVPYGYLMSVYMGWARHQNLSRPYLGVDIGHSLVSRTGQFYNILLRAGGFNNDGLEDGCMLLSGSLTSRLISWNKLLLRQMISADFTRLFNQKTSLPLDIHNEFGIRGFVADSLFGQKRFHINSETIAFTPINIFGFRIAPFTYGEMAWISNHSERLLARDPYFGIGGGVRTRNENLVFGTVELRFLYFPRTYSDITKFNIRLSSNLRIKYSASFVRAPSFVTYN